MLLHGLLRILPDVARQFVTSDHLIFARLGHFEIRTGCLAADYADVLEVFNRLSVSVINVYRHFQGAVLKSSGQSQIWEVALFFEPTHFQVKRR